jgi:aldehyde dehydrogenase (NAD+)
MLQDNAESFTNALAADIGKPKQETWFTELGFIIERSLTAAEQIEEWTKAVPADAPDWQKPWSPTLHKTPRGTVLIIA